MGGFGGLLGGCFARGFAGVFAFVLVPSPAPSSQVASWPGPSRAELRSTTAAAGATTVDRLGRRRSGVGACDLIRRGRDHRKFAVTGRSLEGGLGRLVARWTGDGTQDQLEPDHQGSAQQRDPQAKGQPEQDEHDDRQPVSLDDRAVLANGPLDGLAIRSTSRDTRGASARGGTGGRASASGRVAHVRGRGHDPSRSSPQVRGDHDDHRRDDDQDRDAAQVPKCRVDERLSGTADVAVGDAHR